MDTSKRARVSDLRTTMTFMTITVPKAVSRETFLEMRFTTIRRTLVKVPSYNTRISQCGSLRIRWLLRKNRTREGTRGWKTKKSARCYATRGGEVGVHLVLSRRESDVIVCRYKGDSKSEQMAFIVDHRPCRRSPMYRSLQNHEKLTHRHYHGRFALPASPAREHPKSGARQICHRPSTMRTYVIQAWTIAHLKYMYLLILQ